MKLQELLQALKIIEIKNNRSDCDIKKICYNSKLADKDSLFVAIPGYVTDGHRYIEKAIEQGACAIVYQNECAKYHPEVTYIKVADSRYALGLLGSAFFGNPSGSMVVAGITGTNGKTSLTYMLKSIFEQQGKKCGLIGTIQNLIGSEVIDNRGRTTPESLEVQEIIREMKDADCSHLFMEVSSHGLALERVNGVDFDYGIFTNLTQDHLDYHKTFENYFKAKAKLFDQVNKVNIINGDDPWGQKLCKILAAKTEVPVITYGTNPQNDYFAKEMIFETRGTTFTLVTPTGEEQLFLNIPGEFMVYNAMAAIIVALNEGIPLAVIKETLKKIPGIEGRMEILKTDAPFDIVIDYAHSPDSLEKLLQSVRKIFTGRMVLVFGCNGDRDREKRPIMGRIAGTYADVVVVTSDNPASENPMDIIDAVVSGVREKTDQYATVEVRSDGVYHGAALCQPGDVLVLAGKGHEKQEIMKNETLYYNEWDTAREAVARLKIKAEN
ncbi:UDP-N-acetylmuramoyl-L-alanyl-D-glutamate--2,6-diaminopimelate ligase [Acetobacterium woodii]|uniref:UDP-N-acetylmuramoyl-L-alanyl-D-glutamate--L-lysine ligase n=1 Tax=Acetobacterium woodii (strain ATCC 29683 / DSM 1030 / JCM 2381 / KCTC 1655 / WB1) TaxID=931626 RepID=H6LB87_ACEWD|nr:UDP-N-acetylmuramoyl-L-alanyl-D-glutamate--2,6-diaminopimelate ligase [Acetobacterium woodii]AFA47639.1 UDP-N-acetylmuramoylalanyl-D-glutamate-2,6-diaminopimelate ligase MurE [Acetobacterium woodii DSM 1030]